MAAAESLRSSMPQEPNVGHASARSRANIVQVAAFVLAATLAPFVLERRVAGALAAIVLIVLILRFAPMLWSGNDVSWNENGLTGPRRVGFFWPPRIETISWNEGPVFRRTGLGFRLEARGRCIDWTQEYSASALLEVLGERGIHVVMR
jgi:hypothetical protein